MSLLSYSLQLNAQLFSDDVFNSVGMGSAKSGEG